MKINNNKNGYTIIETMIAVSLFLVITMAGMAALLNANLLQRKSQNMRSIMDNLNFIMEDMSRNIRVGYNYRCYDSGTWSESFIAPNPDLNTPQDCTGGGVIVFEEAHGHTPSSINSPDPDANDQWAYKIESPDGFLPYNIYKSIDGGSSWVQLNPDEVTLDPSSSFVVTGSEPTPNMEQPYVTIKLVGEITYKNVVTPFILQTSVSQRIIDI